MAVETENGKAADYEQVRSARIEENRRRMEELGLLNLAKEVSAEVSEVRKKRHRPQTEKKPLRVSTPPPARRSSRLQNATPVSYAELPHWHEQEETTKNPEIYTEEHEKLLGSYKSEWVLFQDGYGPDGNRIYDATKGKTCHQCRQKTLGHRTRCSTCDLVQGQFCGDCLYTRYGENVLEANNNPEWVCPVCRGICNCSLCRIKKGWAPTGYLYRKAASQGFKSVAHYLILTRRFSTKSESTDTISTNCYSEDNKDDVSLNGTRRALTFASLPNVACCKREENNSLHNLAFCNKEDTNSLPNSECCKREENDFLPNSACNKRGVEPGEDSIICNTERSLADEKMALKAESETHCGDVEIISIEETKQDKNYIKLVSQNDCGDVEIISNGETEHDKNQRKSSKAVSHNDSGDVEIVSIEEPEQDKNQRSAKAVSHNDSGDVEIVAIEEPEQDKNQRRSARRNIYVRGGVAERLRRRITRKTRS